MDYLAIGEDGGIRFIKDFNLLKDAFSIPLNDIEKVKRDNYAYCLDDPTKEMKVTSLFTVQELGYGLLYLVERTPSDIFCPEGFYILEDGKSLNFKNFKKVKNTKYINGITSKDLKFDSIPLNKHIPFKLVTLEEGKTLQINIKKVRVINPKTPRAEFIFCIQKENEINLCISSSVISEGSDSEKFDEFKVLLYGDINNDGVDDFYGPKDSVFPINFLLLSNKNGGYDLLGSGISGYGESIFPMLDRNKKIELINTDYFKKRFKEMKSSEKIKK